MNYEMRKIKTFLSENEALLECGHTIHPDDAPLTACGTLGVRCYLCGTEAVEESAMSFSEENA